MTTQRAHQDPRSSVSDSPGVWLDAMGRLLRLPGKEGEAIREELEGHLRDRVRDLMLEGINEYDATRMAVAELGDAASVAHRFRSAYHRKRRIIMQTAVILVAGSALGLSTVGLMQDSGQQTVDRAAEVISQAAQDGQLRIEPRLSEDGTMLTLELSQRGVPILGEIPLLNQYFVPGTSEVGSVVRVVTDGSFAAPTTAYRGQDLPAVPARIRDVKVVVDVETTIGALASVIHDATGIVIAVRSGVIGDECVGIDEPLGLSIDGATTIDTVFRLLNSEFRRAGSPVLVAVDEGGMVEFTTLHEMDVRSRYVECYNLSELFDSDEEAEAFLSAVVEIVEPEGWDQNGGDVASMHAVGHRVFLNAPKRFHEGFAWMLGQVRNGDSD